MVGLIGKPNTGKSSFFNAATLLDAPVANYPFTTIEPNVGVAYITRKCVCRELGVQDNPKNSACVDGGGAGVGRLIWRRQRPGVVVRVAEVTRPRPSNR